MPICNLKMMSGVDHIILQTLFIGIGADEQMGGYARHRTKFRLSFNKCFEGINAVVSVFKCAHGYHL